MAQSLVKILLIEDSISQAKILHGALLGARNDKFQLVHVDRLSQAIHQVKTERFDIILLDLTLPDSSGLESLEPLLQEMPSLPIVVLTNTNDEKLALDAVRQGAQDYLVKNQVNTELLVRSMRYAIERKQASEALRQANESLEIQVQHRTAELAQANELLKQEIKERERFQSALMKEKELAQITLHSIGDAVITTDVQGRIESLNSVAEKIMGWQLAAAKGKNLAEVFQIYDEKTGETAKHPIDSVLQDGCIIEPSIHILSRANDNREFVIEHSAAPIRLRNHAIMGAVLVCRDVTHAHNLASQLSWHASHDSLTSLINRRQFELHLEKALVSAKSMAIEHSLCYLDLDNFKIVNDTCGHPAGDELLRQVASLLQDRLRKSDILARLGGDEFALLLYGCSQVEGYAVASKLLESIKAFRFIWNERPFTVGVSIGLVTIDSSVDSLAHVLTNADSAMYAAKDRGRNRIHVYQADDHELAKRHGDMQWVAQIIKALEKDRFCLYFQSIVAIQSVNRSRQHYELLLRMYDDSGKLVPPAAFMPAAERYNLMTQVDRWVIRTLLTCLWKTSSPSNALYTINLSEASLNDDEFFDFLKEQLERFQISPSQICFEIAEALTINHLNKAARFIGQLKKLGCYFSLDDFGSGMSSLSYLKNLPVDYLKIDSHFIKGIVEDPIHAAMVEAINHIGHVMGLQTIAKYVESEAILQKVQFLGIDYAQGYQVDTPSPLHELLNSISAASPVMGQSLDVKN